MRSFEEDSLTLKSSKLHHYHLLSSGMHQDALEELDKASAAFSIETRYPFFDKRLIEFSLALPAEQKLWDGWDRIILRRAMSNILQREVLWRKEKSDLAPVFSRNIRIFGKDHISNILSQDSDLLNKYVNLDKLSKSYESLLNERMVNDPVLWQAICLSYWLKNNNANLG
jgi:asparagine synthase (glutamine-hydrolysing)